MNIQQPLLRVAAATTAIFLMTVGVVGPVHAAPTESDDTSTSSQEAETSEQDEAESADSESTESDDADRQARTERADREHAPASKQRNADAPAGAKSKGDENGNGHTPATVCHRLGNGSYNLLTFDENALDAHMRHGDLEVPSSGECPGATDETVKEHGNNGNGHTPVTVCHVLGNGSYNLLTFDDSALPAHIDHGDVYPAPADDADCAEAAAGEAPLDSPSSTSESAELTAEAMESADSSDVEVLGVEAERTVAEQAPVVNRAPAEVASASGILPSTGAGDYLMAILAGVGLLAAGGALLARKRPQTGR